MSDSEHEQEISDLSSPDVTTKYRAAGDIINKALEHVIKLCVPEADIATICEAGDKFIEDECAKLYNKKDKDGRKIDKGVAFPVCVSVNDIAGHYSPFKGESRQLKAGDIAKLDMACHFDGFIASAGHTVIVAGEKVEDKRADVINAAWNGMQAAIRLVQVGKKSTQVTEAFGKIANDYNCKPVEGADSHEMKKHVINGNQAILSVENTEEKVNEFEFKANEVYCIDVMFSTGEGKPKEMEVRHTVYKRQVENSYSLKTAKARQFISEVNRRFPALPFSLRAIEDEQVARVGVSESKRHELLDEYAVLKERDGDIVAQFKCTLLLLPGGTKQITGLPFGDLENLAVSALEVKDEDIKKLLATSVASKKKKKAKKDTKTEEPAEK